MGGMKLQGPSLPWRHSLGCHFEDGHQPRSYTGSGPSANLRKVWQRKTSMLDAVGLQHMVSRCIRIVLSLCGNPTIWRALYAQEGLLCTV
jgi:hypothetical protein